MSQIPSMSQRPAEYDDPAFQQLPDGRWTYTPGKRGLKFMTTLLGALIVAFGIWWQWDNFVLVLFGESTSAKVAYVVEERLGQEPVKLDTVRAVADANDPTRNATFYYHVVFTTQAGEDVTARLNYGQAVRPLLSIGTDVFVAYDPEDPSVVIRAWDHHEFSVFGNVFQLHLPNLSTWAFGFFFMGTGLLLFIPQLFLFLAAGKPIILDPIIDYEDLAKEKK